MDGWINEWVNERLQKSFDAVSLFSWSTLNLGYRKIISMVISTSLTSTLTFSFQFQRRATPKKCSNYPTIALISHASKVMLKIHQGRLQQYVNWELPAGFRTGRGTRDQIANIHWIIWKAREFQKKHLLLLHWLCLSLWLCGSQQTVETS